MASEKQATDIVLLDVRQICSFADYFLIASGQSDRQLEALAEDIEKVLKESGAASRREGAADSGWILIDASDLIVHLLSPAARAFYELDSLWGKAVPLMRMQ